MRQSLEALQVSYGMDCMLLTVELRSSGNWELRIDFTFSNGTKLFMHYNHVRVGPATDNYRLSMLGVTGITSEDPFTAGHFMNGQQFSTYVAI